MTGYDVRFTDKLKTPITIAEGEENNTSTDISLFGNTFLEYGQELNENILHLLEKFACPMVAGGTLATAVPDTAATSYNGILSKPVDGQLWYNTSLKKLYYYDASVPAWRPLSTQNDVAANWGLLGDGYQLPRPQSATTGYVFPYSECIWSISPANFGGVFDYMECSTDPVATVNMKYRYPGSTDLVSGVANYLIIGIRGNTNTGIGFGTPVPNPTPTPSSGATSTPTPTPTPTQGVTPTPTPTPSHAPVQIVFTPASLCTGVTYSTANPGSSSQITPKQITTTLPYVITASGGFPYGYGYNFVWSQIDGYPLDAITVTNTPTTSSAKFTATGFVPWSGRAATCDNCDLCSGCDGLPANFDHQSPANCGSAACARVKCVITDSHGNSVTTPPLVVSFVWKSAGCSV